MLGSLGLVFLAETLRQILPGHRTYLAYALILAVPELWIYYPLFQHDSTRLAFLLRGALLALP